jgi:RHS repeat-associated protein
VFDGANILTERQGGAVSAAYSYGQSLLRRNDEFPYFDALSITRAVGNTGEQVTATRTFDAFGQIVGSAGQTSLPFLYGGTVGYRNDGDAGLLHIGARYYDPQVGIFISRDSDLSEHPYKYCDGDPINHDDPDGHAKKRRHTKQVGGGSGMTSNAKDMPRRVPKHMPGGAGKWKWVGKPWDWRLVRRGTAGLFALVVVAADAGAALAHVVTDVTRPDPRYVLPDPTMDPGPGAGNLPAYSQGARLGLYGGW